MNSQQGSLNLLSIIFLTIIISTILIAVNIGFLITQKQNLQNLVDQAALAAVQEIDLVAYYERGLTSSLALDKTKARATAQGFVSKHSRFENEIGLEISFNQSEILITGEVVVTLPLAPNLLQVPIRASAGARLVVGF